VLPHAADRQLDGQSIVSLLRGRPGPRRKWIYSQVGGNRKVRDKRFILHANGKFFDLKNDPYEKSNLSAGSDAEIAAARERLGKVLDAMPADKEMTGFPDRYSKTGKVPLLPAGSGKWKAFKATGKTKKPKRLREGKGRKKQRKGEKAANAEE